MVETYYDPDFKHDVMKDYAYDKHIAKGRKLGRGTQHFILEGSKVVNLGYPEMYKDEFIEKPTAVNLPYSKGKFDVFTTRYATYYGFHKDGSIYACGDNSYGKLGVGDDKNKYTPIPVKGPCDDFLGIKAS